MKPLDWMVLLGTIVVIVVAGLYKERGKKSSEEYLRGGSGLRWWTVGLSVMATQASAITFLSMPGQAYEDGMGFIQFYLGLPIAMIILSIWIVPIFYRLKVYTAYEYLEMRFDRRTRQLVAFLFLLSRGLASGIAIYAPAIVLATVLGWPLQITNLTIGIVTIAYTVSGGSTLVARTQTYQMVVMLAGMAAAAFVIWHQLPAELSFNGALHLAGALGHLHPIDYSLRFDARYTFWSGLLGGLFVQLAYFGTDQSQVQRYLGGASLGESRLGLLFNGLLKVPMQFLILFVGVLVFVFYQFHPPPVFFDRARWSAIAHGEHAAEAHAIEIDQAHAFAIKRDRAQALLSDRSPANADALRASARDADAVRARARELVKRSGSEVKDSDFIFIDFVVSQFPSGFVGLLLAVILSAAMSAVAAALTSLGTTTVVDFYRVSFKPTASDAHYVAAGKWFTVMWGAVAVSFAALASRLDNLIQAVNILGSIFYGPMLGIFTVGFFLPHVRARPALAATVVAQLTVVVVFLTTRISFLWYNVIGAVVLIGLALALQQLSNARKMGEST